MLAVGLGELGELGELGGVEPDFLPLLQDVSARPTTSIAATQDLPIEPPFTTAGSGRHVAGSVRRRVIVNSVIHRMVAAPVEGRPCRRRVATEVGMRETVNRLLRIVAGAPLGWVVTAAGAALLVVGWYGISGESVVAKQLPYLASATIPGAALLVAGLLVAARAQTGERDRQLLADLHAALLTPEPAPAPQVTDDGLWATARGQTYHRAGCPLARHGADKITEAQVCQRGLEPCPVCDPPAVDG